MSFVEWEKLYLDKVLPGVQASLAECWQRYPNDPNAMDFMLRRAFCDILLGMHTIEVPPNTEKIADFLRRIANEVADTWDGHDRRSVVIDALKAEVLNGKNETR